MTRRNRKIKRAKIKKYLIVVCFIGIGLWIVYGLPYFYVQ